MAKIKKSAKLGSKKNVKRTKVSKAPRARVGRPKATTSKLGSPVQVNFTATQKKALDAAARAAGLGVATFARVAILEKLGAASAEHTEEVRALTPEEVKTLLAPAAPAEPTDDQLALLTAPAPVAAPSAPRASPELVITATTELADNEIPF